MKKCFNCECRYTAASDLCLGCGFSPPNINGFINYAPEFSYSGGGFKSQYFETLAYLESCNFWFRVRNHIVIWAITKYAASFKSFFEIGCGTGFVLSEIKKITQTEI